MTEDVQRKPPPRRRGLVRSCEAAALKKLRGMIWAEPKTLHEIADIVARATGALEPDTSHALWVLRREGRIQMVGQGRATKYACVRPKQA